MYDFMFHYDRKPESMTILPLAPEYLKTHEKSLNKIIELMNGGEVNLLRGLALRDLNLKILLPKNNVITEMSEQEFHKPAFYLDRFRNFIANKKPVRLTVTRHMQNGETIFAGNILVSFEDYRVFENAGEEGDFWVELNLKEYGKSYY